MKKRLFAFAAATLLFLLFGTAAGAAETPEDYVDAFEGLVGESELASGEILREKLTFSSLFSSASDLFAQCGGEILRVFLLVLAVGVLSALGERFCGSGEVRETAASAVFCVTFLALYRALSGTVEEVLSALGGLSSFLSGAIPIVTGLIAAGGAAVPSARRRRRD